jgi:cysteine/O-acetylserine efflux protein
MENINLFTFLSFVFVTTFTPGPNNISSASMGVLYGFKKTSPYRLGIATGFVFVMLLCGAISTTLQSVFPAFETALHYIGAIYILWLAYETLRMSYTFEEGDQTLMGFTRGLLLQVLNPKVVIYGLALYSTFLLPITDNLFYTIISAIFLATVALSSTSVWALFGSAIRNYLKNPKVRQLVNLALSLLLVYTAIELSGILA